MKFKLLMKTLVIIPARKGSKRLKKKNLKIINKKPLVQLTIEFALKLFEGNNILLSTNCKKIIKIGKKLGILAPWIRPKNLSNDKSSSESVVIHALKWYQKKIQKVDCLILLQPTTPFRNIKNLLKGIEIFEKNKSFSIISVKEVKKNKFFLKKKKNILKNHKNLFIPNGSFYMINPKNLLKYKTFYTKKIKGILIKNIEENIDIDTHQDFLRANEIVKKNKFVQN